MFAEGRVGPPSWLCTRFCLNQILSARWRGALQDQTAMLVSRVLSTPVTTAHLIAIPAIIQAAKPVPSTSSSIAVFLDGRRSVRLTPKQRLISLEVTQLDCKQQKIHMTLALKSSLKNGSCASHNSIRSQRKSDTPAKL